MLTSLKERADRVIARARESSSLVDRVWVAVQHFVRVGGNRQAASATYFAFLSFFPILALGFFAVGYVARVFPDAQQNLIDALNALFPGMIGNGEGQVPISLFTENAGKVGIIGLAGVLYAGLGWLSGMRFALWVMFTEGRDDRPNFLIAKLRDLITLLTLGATLLLSVSLSSAVNGFSADLLKFLGADPNDPWPGRLMWLVATSLAIGVATLLFLTLFHVLARPDESFKVLAQGALVAAVLFEILKWLAVTLISHTSSQPAFQAFGVTLVMLVWINYSTQIAMFGAAWAWAGENELED